MTFIPAHNKLEAVSRIGRISGGPAETLGPGSKERKTVLTNLYLKLELDVDPKKTKQQLARELVTSFNGTWESSCESAGQTLTLIGLNKILRIAEAETRKKNRSISTSNFTLNEEVSAIEETILQNLPFQFEGKACVMEMRDSEDKNWRQTEWQGWYFEYLALPNLIQNLGGGKRRLGAVTFDYQLRRTWDLKTHSEHLISTATKIVKDVPLNDLDAMKDVIDREGLGLIILNGEGYLDRDFSIWHKELRGKNGLPRRLLKSKFVPTSLDFFWFNNVADLNLANEAGVLKRFNQGKQTNGSSRRAKFMLDLSRARKSKFLISTKSLSQRDNP